MFRTGFDHGELLSEVSAERTQEHAQTRHLLREAGIERQRWATRQKCMLFCKAGRVLVAWGQTLQRWSEPQSRSLEKQAT